MTFAEILAIIILIITMIIFLPLSLAFLIANIFAFLFYSAKKIIKGWLIKTILFLLLNRFVYLTLISWSFNSDAVRIFTHDIIGIDEIDIGLFSFILFAYTIISYRKFSKTDSGEGGFEKLFGKIKSDFSKLLNNFKEKVLFVKMHYLGIFLLIFSILRITNLPVPNPLFYVIYIFMYLILSNVTPTIPIDFLREQPIRKGIEVTFGILEFIGFPFEATSFVFVRNWSIIPQFIIGVFLIITGFLKKANKQKLKEGDREIIESEKVRFIEDLIKETNDKRIIHNYEAFKKISKYEKEKGITLDINSNDVMDLIVELFEVYRLEKRGSNVIEEYFSKKNKPITEENIKIEIYNALKEVRKEIR